MHQVTHCATHRVMRPALSRAMLGTGGKRRASVGARHHRTNSSRWYSVGVTTARPGSM
jgi:hypothetical protein